MGKKKASGGVVSGHIDTKMIYDTHRQIKSIVDDYGELNKKVNDITVKVNESWVGKGNNEFQSQYKILIRKIDDFGEILLDIYNGLVEAEGTYEDKDDDIRQDFVMAKKS